MDYPPPTSPVWPPPPAGSPQPTPTSYELPLVSDFKPIMGFKIPLMIGLIVTALLQIGRAVLFGTDGLPINSARPVCSSAAFAYVALGAKAAYLVTATVFVLWTYHAYRNLRAISTGETRFSLGWAITSFFVPFLALYRPVQIFEEIWRRSEPYPLPNAQRAPVLIWLWWICNILVGILTYFMPHLYGDPGDPIVPEHLVPGVICAALSATFACWMVNAICKRVHNRYDGLMAALNGVPQSQSMA